MKKIIAMVLSLALISTPYSVISYAADNVSEDITVSQSDNASENTFAFSVNDMYISDISHSCVMNVEITDDKAISSLEFTAQCDDAIISQYYDFDMVDGNGNVIGTSEVTNEGNALKWIWNSDDGQDYNLKGNFVRLLIAVDEETTEQGDIFNIFLKATTHSTEADYDYTYSENANVTVDNAYLEGPIAKFSCTDTYAQPGGIAYVDLSVDENKGFFGLLLQYVLDTDYFSIESIYADKETRFFGDGNISPEDYPDTWAFNPQNNYFLCLRVYNEVFETGSFVRLAIRVDEDTPEGEYEILPQVLQCCSNDSYEPLRDAEYTAGKIIVSKKKKEVNIKPIPLVMKLYTPIGEIGSSESILAGDINYDGSVDSHDALCILQSVVGQSETSVMADIDEDTEITSADALEILKYIVD